MPAEFTWLYTAIGLTKRAAAEAGGAPIDMTGGLFLVGDGNGVVHTAAEILANGGLYHQVWSGAINRVYQHQIQTTLVVIEAIIPPESGGWTIREVAIKDTAGDLILVGNYPASEKPAPGSGGEKQILVRGGMRISNGGDTVVQIDASLIMATQKYVDLRMPRTVRVATTANSALSGLLTEDGAVTAADDLVLVWKQDVQTQNGIYKVVAGGAWIRAMDAIDVIEMIPGMLVSVSEGALHGNKVFQLTTDGPIVLGTTALTFTQVFPDESSRTITVAAPTGDTAAPATLFSWLGYMIKAITGKATWRTAPATTLEAAATHIAAATPHSGHAPINNAALTGTPTCPTAAAGTNTNQISNTAFVHAAIAALVASSPAALDTLNELAAALGNDANFATTVTNALAGKAALTANIFTGVQTFDAGLFEKEVAMAANDIDVTLGTHFIRGAITGNTTLTVSNVPAAGKVPLFLLDITNGGAYTLTLWSTIKWTNGRVPTLAVSGRDVLGFYRANNIWNGFRLGGSMA